MKTVRSFFALGVASMTVIASMAIASSAASARCAYVNRWSAPLYLCNPHRAEQSKDCQSVIRYAREKDLFYVLWLEAPFGAASMYYLKNVDNAREAGWIHANQINIDEYCSKRTARGRARKG